MDLIFVFILSAVAIGHHSWKIRHESQNSTSLLQFRFDTDFLNLNHAMPCRSEGKESPVRMVSSTPKPSRTPAQLALLDDDGGRCWSTV